MTIHCLNIVEMGHPISTFLFTFASYNKRFSDYYA